MAIDILESILAVEQEIRERLAAEERLAEQMLDLLRRELEQEAVRERERLESGVRQAVAAARAEADERAAAMIRTEQQRASQLEALSEETLARCISKHLGRIAGERGQ